MNYFCLRLNPIIASLISIVAFFAISASLLAQQVWINEVWKTQGATITIDFQYPDSSRLKEFRLLRSTETGSPAVIAIGGPATRRFSVIMPTGTSKRYYYRVRPVILNSNGSTNVGPACEEVIVNR